MIRTQIQIPDELYRATRRIASEKEMSFAEICRRGLEYMAGIYPEQAAKSGEWELPPPLDLGVKKDPFSYPNWREEANLGSGAARMVADAVSKENEESPT